MVCTDPTQENTGRRKNMMELVLWTCAFSSQLGTGTGRGKFLAPGWKSGVILLLTSQELPGAQRADGCTVFSSHRHRTFLLWWGTQFCCYWPVFLKLVNTGTFQRAWSELLHREWFSVQLSGGWGCRRSISQEWAPGWAAVSLTPTSRECC